MDMMEWRLDVRVKYIKNNYLSNYTESVSS